MTKPILIGIMGAAGVGKDTAADRLAHVSGGMKRAWAKPVYDMVNALLYDLHITPRWNDREWKESALPLIGQSPRALLQELGTKWGRGFSEDFWLTPMQVARDRMASQGYGLIIPDVRFDNEAEWVTRNGGLLLWVASPRAQKVRDHVTTQAVWERHAHTVIRNFGGLEDLYPQLDDVLESLWASKEPVNG